MAARKQTKPTKAEPKKSIKGVEPAQRQEVTIENGDVKPVTDRDHQEKLKILRAYQAKNPGAIVPASEVPPPYFLRRPTGIMGLDIALAGGFPAGGGSILSGPYGSCKSWMLWRLFAMQQRIYRERFKGALVCTEGPPDLDYMRKSGLHIQVSATELENIDRTRYSRGEPLLTHEEIDTYGRQIGTVDLIRGKAGEDGEVTGESILQTVLDVARLGAYDIIGVDSLQGLEPQANAAKEMEDELKRAAHAVMIKNFWTKYVQYIRMGKIQTTLMMVQQVVAKDMSKVPSFMQNKVKEWETKGGEASKHYKLIDLQMWNGAVTKDNNKRPIFKEVHWEIKKGKAGTHEGITGDFGYYYDTYINDWAREIVLFAYQMGLVLNHGNSLSLAMAHAQRGKDVRALDDDETKYASDAEIVERLYKDPHFEFVLRREICQAAGIVCSIGLNEGDKPIW
jgi:RecA/RadA recombinase